MEVSCTIVIFNTMFGYRKPICLNIVRVEMLYFCFYSFKIAVSLSSMQAMIGMPPAYHNDYMKGRFLYEPFVYKLANGNDGNDTTWEEKKDGQYQGANRTSYITLDCEDRQ